LVLQRPEVKESIAFLGFRTRLQNPYFHSLTSPPTTEARDKPLPALRALDVLKVYEAALVGRD
jgi:hypothetical protein